MVDRFAIESRHPPAEASRVVVVKFSTHPEPAGVLFGDMFTATTALAQGIGGAKL